MDNRDTEELEVLAMTIHGALALGHLVGVVYNYRRKNWRVTWAHITALVFEVFCVYHHWKGKKACAKPSSSS